MSANPSASTAPDARGQFLRLLADALEQGSLSKLVLARHVGADQSLQRIIAKPLLVKGQPSLSLVYRHQTRDITRNVPVEQVQALVAELLPDSFRNAHLFTTDGEVQLAFSKKASRCFSAMWRRLRAKPRLRLGMTARRNATWSFPGRSCAIWGDRWPGRADPVDVAQVEADQQVHRSLRPCPGQCPLAAAQPLRVADFGSGKGYLTFAMHDYLRNSLGREAQVTGVELRQDMVDLCNTAAARLEHPGLVFECGDVRSVVPEAIEVMIALHACDIATDYAIHTGIRCNAAIIMCSPCCHKQVRPQLQSPGLLQPMLQYGLHLGQQAEMLTDSLRALYLEACGYETKVFEFISLEHTNKNKMILAVKRKQPVDATALCRRLPSSRRSMASASIAWRRCCGRMA